MMHRPVPCLFKRFVRSVFVLIYSPLLHFSSSDSLQAAGAKPLTTPHRAKICHSWMGTGELSHTGNFMGPNGSTIAQNTPLTHQIGSRCLQTTSLLSYSCPDFLRSYSSFHAKFFLEMAAKYDKELARAQYLLLSVWATVLCICDLR